MNGVQLVLGRGFYKNDNFPINDSVLNERQKKALNYIKENGFITNKIYQELNSCSDSTSKRDLVQLVSMNIIKTEGKGRNLRYVQSGHNRVIIGSTYMTRLSVFLSLAWMLPVESLKNFRNLVTDFKSCFMKRNLPFRLIK